MWRFDGLRPIVSSEGDVIMLHTGKYAYAPSLEYLPVNLEKMQMKEMFAGEFLFVTRSALSAQILKWAVLCSLKPECIEPKGAARHCWWVGEYDRWYEFSEAKEKGERMKGTVSMKWSRKMKVVRPSRYA
uniref:Uncharacterized protein n=1 Tax=Plectus sambesii TaxID=2011161 RepID=A0A914WLN9_9BILA